MDEGEHHLRRITQAMLAVGLLGVLLWGLFRSWTAALAFGVGCLTSFGFWGLHRVLTGRMLPYTRRKPYRWPWGSFSSWPAFSSRPCVWASRNLKTPRLIEV